MNITDKTVKIALNSNRFNDTIQIKAVNNVIYSKTDSFMWQIKYSLEIFHMTFLFDVIEHLLTIYRI